MLSFKFVDLFIFLDQHLPCLGLGDLIVTLEHSILIHQCLHLLLHLGVALAQVVTFSIFVFQRLLNSLLDLIFNGLLVVFSLLWVVHINLLLQLDGQALVLLLQFQVFIGQLRVVSLQGL